MLEAIEQLYSSASPEGEAMNYPVREHTASPPCLCHTPVEQRLYEEMLAQTRAGRATPGAFSIRRLMALTGIHSQSTVRRGRDGLLSKLSIGREEQGREAHPATNASIGILYRVFTPEEIIERRKVAGIAPCPERSGQDGLRSLPHQGSESKQYAVKRASDMYGLSHRQAQVAAACAEGMTNQEIANRLSINTETVKFHLKHVFLKCGVSRRTELIARLLMPQRVEKGKKG